MAESQVCGQGGGGYGDEWVVMQFIAFGGVRTRIAQSKNLRFV
jgi:hypothetical protein